MNKLFGVVLIIGGLWGQIPANIHSVPTGAIIRINGIDVGLTPLEAFRLGTGDQNFEIILEGYAPAKKTIEVQEAKSMTIEFRLKKLYNITLTTDEPGLEFVFNKIDTVRGNKNNLVIEEGEHHFQVFREGEQLDEKLIIIDRNKTMKYMLRQKQEISRDDSD